MACLARVRLLSNIIVHHPMRLGEKGGEEKTLMYMSPTATHRDTELQKDEKTIGMDEPCLCHPSSRYHSGTFSVELTFFGEVL